MKSEANNVKRLERTGYLLMLGMPAFALGNLFSLVQVGGLSIRPTDVLFVLAFFTLALDAFFTLRLHKGIGLYVICLMVLVATTLTGTLFLGNAVDWPSYFRFLQTMLWGALALAFLRTEKQFYRYTEIVTLAAGVLGASSIYLYIQNPELQRLAGYMFYGGSEPIETAGGVVNQWAAFDVLTITILLWRAEKDGWSAYRLILLGLITAGLVFTQSRSGFLALGMVILIFSVYWMVKIMRQGMKRGPVTSLACVILLLGGIIVGSSYLPVNRIQDSFVSGSNTDVSTNDRYIGWQKSIDLWGASVPRFLLGYGNEKFVELLGTPTSESFYFDHGVSEGFFGLLLMLSLLLAPVYKFRKAGILNLDFMLIALATMVAIIVCITGNMLPDPIYGGVTFSLLYGFVAATNGSRLKGSL
jgi:hypothetical protein